MWGSRREMMETMASHMRAPLAAAAPLCGSYAGRPEPTVRKGGTVSPQQTHLLQ